MTRKTTGNVRAELNLPPGLKERILGDERLNSNQKFILLSLYYLDSRSILDGFKTYLPRFLGLEWPVVEEELQGLEDLDYIEVVGERLILKVKPIFYAQ